MTPNPATSGHCHRASHSDDACRVTIFDADAFDFDTSPACTSIAMFRSPSPVNQSAANDQQQQPSDESPARCPICVEPFAPHGAAVPKTLQCGHSFCAECIFSLCLHKEYYLLESIFCLKCGAPCDAGQAMNAPSAAALSNDKNSKSNKLMDGNSENDHNITVIHLTNTQATSPASNQKNTVIQNRQATARPILGTATLSLMTPRRRVRARRSGGLAQPPPPSQPPALSPWSADEPNYYSDNCGTSAADYERIGRYYRPSSAASGCYQPRRCMPSARSTEMETELNSDYGSGSCITTTAASRAKNNMSRWCGKFVRRTRRMDAQLTRARQIVRAAYLASELKAEIEATEHVKNDSTKATVAGDGYDDVAQRRCVSDETRAHFQRYANVLAAYDEAKRILKREFAAMQVDDVRAVRELTCRLDTLRQCLEQCRFDFEARRVAASSIVSAIDGICACVDAIVALSDTDALKMTVEALEKLTRSMRAAAGADGQRPNVGRSLADTVRLLTALLNKRTSVETIPFFDLAFAFAFRALKRIVRATQRAHDVNDRQVKLWKMAQSAYSELLRVAGTHWSCADTRRVALVASTAQMCELFAEVCDTATVLLCIIEAARARVALANAAAATALADDDGDELTASPSVAATTEQSRAQFHLKRIDDHLLECRRVQKLVELRTRTRLLNKQIAMDVGVAPPTPASVARHAAAAVAARLTPRKRAAVGNASADVLMARKPLNCTADETPAVRRRPPFWRRILPLRIFRATAY